MELVEGVLRAYGEGWFPMADPGRGVVEWVQPEVRGVMPLESGKLHFPKSLLQRVRSGRFEVKADVAFEEVMRACAAPREGREETWIDGSIIRVYCALHRAGYAHSIEARRDGRLVGGLYGVEIGGAFFGESMFSIPEGGGTDASKVCLVHLVHHLRRRGFVLLDAQFWNAHLDRFGCERVASGVYLKRLKGAIGVCPGWGEFDAVRTVAELRSVASLE